MAMFSHLSKNMVEGYVLEIAIWGLSAAPVRPTMASQTGTLALRKLYYASKWRKIAIFGK